MPEKYVSIDDVKATIRDNFCVPCQHNRRADSCWSCEIGELLDDVGDLPYIFPGEEVET